MSSPESPLNQYIYSARNVNFTTSPTIKSFQTLSNPVGVTPGTPSHRSLMVIYSFKGFQRQSYNDGGVIFNDDLGTESCSPINLGKTIFDRACLLPDDSWSSSDCAELLLLVRLKPTRLRHFLRAEECEESLAQLLWEYWRFYRALIENSSL